MTKQFYELTEAEFTGLVKETLAIEKSKDAEMITEGFEKSVHAAIEIGKGIKIRGLFTLKIVVLAAKEGANPYNGTHFSSPRRLGIKVVPSPALLKKLRENVAVPQQ